MPPLNMLALRMEQGGRGGGEGGAAWQGRPSARSPSRINIREKISQWEGRSLQAAAVKAHPPAVSRSLSGDVLGGRGSQGDRYPRARLSNARSLDLWESPSKEETCQPKSEPLLKPSTEFSSATPGNKPLTAQRFAPHKADPATGPTASEQSAAGDGQTSRQMLDVRTVEKMCPPAAEEAEDNMPAGNFYTSRGFWRKLEGDRLLWEKGRDSSGSPQPPPKPQRTFQYRGGGEDQSAPPLATLQSRRGTARRTPRQPPSFPPPPCPTANGLSRHKKNRWVWQTLSVFCSFIFEGEMKT